MEYSVCDVLQNFVLHTVESLDYSSLVVVVLNLIFCRHSWLEHGIDQVLEDLPKQEEIVALSDAEIHFQESFTLHVVKFL